jgi:hypothetical protein
VLARFQHARRRGGRPGLHRPGQANPAVVKLPPDGRACYSSFAAADLIVELAGWFVG